MHLLKHKPALDVAAAESLAARLYDIRASARPLPSERDQNFLLQAESSEKFVLKIANGLEEGALLAAQNEALSHLANQLSYCPRIVPTIFGDKMTPIESPGESPARRFHLVRLMTYLPGRPLGEVKHQSPKLLRDLGQKLARLNRALAGFEHPAVHRDFHWDLANGLRVIQSYGELIEDMKLRELVCKCAREFESDISALLPNLRRSVIHGDANDYNVLVSDDDRVVGLIDFGDMVYSYTVGELAVAIAYVVLGKPAPLEAAGYMVAGYTEEYPLTQDEIAALRGLVLLRLCMSVCLAAYQQRQEPANEYLAISQQAIQETLPELVALDFQAAATVFKN